MKVFRLRISPAGIAFMTHMLEAWPARTLDPEKISRFPESGERVRATRVLYTKHMKQIKRKIGSLGNEKEPKQAGFSRETGLARWRVRKWLI